MLFVTEYLGLHTMPGRQELHDKCMLIDWNRRNMFQQKS